MTSFIERWKRERERERERERVLILTHILSSLKVAILMKFAFISDQRNNHPSYHVKWICINITIMTMVESGNRDVCLECNVLTSAYTRHSDMSLPRLVSFSIITQFTTVFL
jgi:hypothetical protein